MTLRAAAEAVGWDKSALSRLETGKREFTLAEVALLVGLYRVAGQPRDNLLAMARAMDEPGWWVYGNGGVPTGTTVLADYEAEAVRVADWAPLIIPGLLQTMDYAVAWMSSGDPVEPGSLEQRVAARVDRQRILTGKVDYVAFIGEGALRTPVGEPGVLANQLAVLREMGQRRNVTVRVVPLDAGPHRGQLGAFHILEFPAAPPVVLLENLLSSLFLDGSAHTAPYVKALPRLAEIALSQAESARLITRIQANWARQSAGAGRGAMTAALPERH